MGVAVCECEEESHGGQKCHFLLLFHQKNLTQLNIHHDYKLHKALQSCQKKVTKDEDLDPHDFREECVH